MGSGFGSCHSGLRVWDSGFRVWYFALGLGNYDQGVEF